MRLSTVVLIAAVAATAASFTFPEATSVRVKRQQCRCVRLVSGGGMQCSCMQPLATNELGTQQGGLASQVSQAGGNPSASCQCIQIFISNEPTYRCMCNPPGTINPPQTTVGITVQTTVPVHPTQTTQPTQPTQTTPTLPPITLPPITTPPTTVTQTVTTPPTVPPTQTFPPITTPPTTTPATYTTSPTTFQTPPLITSPPLITPSSTFAPITTPPVTYPVTYPTVTTVSPLPTPGPSSTTPGFEPPVTQTVPPNQACQCIMIRINGPANAQYQCSCPGVANPIPVAPGGTGTGVTGAPGSLPVYNDSPTATNPYPATGVTNGTSAGCFCLDGPNPNLGCGCSCDCFSLTVTIPTGVCVCPQDDTGRVITTPTQPGVQTTPAYTNPVTQSPVQPGQTLPPITPTQTTYYTAPTTVAGSSQTQQPLVYPPTQTVQPGQPTQTLQPTQPVQQTTLAPIVPVQTASTPSRDGSATTTLPLTTTCILYPVTATATSPQCTCMPQYEQCAQNVCCLSTRFRSHKNDIVRAAADATGVQESTLDIFVDMFNKIKNRFTATA